MACTGTRITNISQKRYTVLMEDKMATRTLGALGIMGEMASLKGKFVI